MSKYDFSTLSADDFEQLSRDLLQKELGLTFESFKSGRDNGIDLRYSTPNNNKEIIIQCKHYLNSGFNKLKSDLSKQELSKIQKLNPKRYILTTSVSMTPTNKNEIVDILSPYINSSSDIFSQDDLNNLLGKNPEIEKQHFKLWLSSTTVLERIMHSEVYNQSNFDLEKIHKKLKIYVINDSFNKAKNILENYSTCIISGIPGIGKTTLAEMLSLMFIEKGYELISIDNFKNINKIYNAQEKQIFYYDDFLGQTSLENKLDKNEELRIVDFIDRISKLKNKKFILTTREYILNQAKQIYTKLNSDRLDLRKCILDIGYYTNEIKAKILYNHLYFSDLAKDHLKSIVTNQNYYDIINHENYNPRIIEWITSNEIANQYSPDEYFEKFLDMLDNPEKIWEDAFNSHLTNMSRNLLIIRRSLPDYIYLDDLKIALANFIDCDPNNLDYNNDFKRSLKEVEGTFISTFESNKKLIITFHNPSIKDFLSNYIIRDFDIVSTIIAKSISLDQIISLNNLFSETDNEKDLQSLLTKSFTIIIKIFNNKKVSKLTTYSYKKDYKSFEERAYELLEIYNFSNNLIKKLFSLIETKLAKSNIPMDKEYILKITRLLFNNKVINEKSEFFQQIKDQFFDDISHFYDISELINFLDTFWNISYLNEINISNKQIIDIIEDELTDFDFDSVDWTIEVLEDINRKLNIDTSNWVRELEDKQIEYAEEVKVMDKQLSEREEKDLFDANNDSEIEIFSIDLLFEGLLDEIDDK